MTTWSNPTIRSTSTRRSACARRRSYGSPPSDAEGQPQSTPVWFWWDGDTFLVYSRPAAKKLRQPRDPTLVVALHLEGIGSEATT